MDDIQTGATHLDKLGELEAVLSHFERLEAQFQQVREGLTHSHRLATLGTVASITAHEYHNILTPIITYAQMALARPSDQELMRTAVEKALNGCERAAKISQSMLGFARENDEQNVAPLRATVDETISCLGRDPRKDGIDLVIDVPDANLAICPLNLQQVLLNLILNAVRAMGSGGGQLRLTGRVEGRHVKIDVADTGPGIPEQILDRLFEPFVTQRAGGAGENGEARGTGLGLCICRDLIQSAGGSIDVRSEPGRGATFHIKLRKAVDIEST